MKWVTRLFACLGIIGLIVTSGYTQIQSRHSKDQSVFGADSEVERQVAVPEAALKILRTNLKASPDELSAEDLKVSEIHLDGSTEVDLVALGVHGAHTVPFYILRPITNGYQLVLSSVGDSMTVLSSRTNGLRNVKVEAYMFAGTKTISIIYRFDGHKYVKH